MSTTTIFCMQFAEIQQQVCTLDSDTTTTQVSKWLPSVATNIHNSFKNLRHDIRSNTISFPYYQYSERLGHFFYELAEICSNIQDNNNPGMALVEECLKKCVSELSQWKGVGVEVKRDAESLLAKIKEDYSQYSRKILSNEQIRSIDILKLIIVLETCISTPTKMDLVARAGTSNLLSILYGMAKVPPLRLKYKTTFDQLTKNNGLSKTNIKVIIRMEIELERADLKKVKEAISKEGNKTNKKSALFIEKEYINCLLNCATKQVLEFLQAVTFSGRKTILFAFENVKSLSSIPLPLCHLPYFVLLKQHLGIIRKKDEKNYLMDLRQKFFGMDSIYKSCSVDVILVKMDPSHPHRDDDKAKLITKEFIPLETLLSNNHRDCNLVQHIQNFVIHDFPNNEEYNEYAKINGEFVVQVSGDDAEMNSTVINHFNDNMISSSGCEVDSSSIEIDDDVNKIKDKMMMSVIQFVIYARRDE